MADKIKKSYTLKIFLFVRNDTLKIFLLFNVDTLILFLMMLSTYCANLRIVLFLTFYEVVLCDS